VGDVVHDKESIHNKRIWKARRCHLNQQNLLFHSKTLQKQFAMLVLPSFHSPLVVIPSEKKKLIPNSQPFLGMAMDEEHEVEIDLLQDVAQVF
jgi:hypothetical protein